MGNLISKLLIITTTLVAVNDGTCLLPWGKECAPKYKCIGHTCVPIESTRNILSEDVVAGETYPSAPDCARAKARLEDDAADQGVNLYCCLYGIGLSQRFVVQIKPCTETTNDQAETVEQMLKETRKRLEESEQVNQMQSEPSRERGQSETDIMWTTCRVLKCNYRAGEKCCCQKQSLQTCSCVNGEQRQSATYLNCT